MPGREREQLGINWAYPNYAPKAAMTNTQAALIAAAALHSGHPEAFIDTTGLAKYYLEWLNNQDKEQS